MSEKDGTERLGPTGRRWLALWRAVYGARLGCYNNKRNHGKRGKQAGTLAAAKAGVLAAAEYAVATGLSGTAQDGGAAVIPLAIQTTYLKSALGDRGEAYNNPSMAAIKKLTQSKTIAAQPFLLG